MDRCLLSDELGPVEGECTEVVILSLKISNIKISTRSKLTFTPKYLDAFSSETAFENNYSAVYELINNDNLSKIKNVLLSDDIPSANIEVELDGIDTLHDRQKSTVQYSVGVKD